MYEIHGGHKYVTISVVNTQKQQIRTRALVRGSQARFELKLDVKLFQRPPDRSDSKLLHIFKYEGVF